MSFMSANLGYILTPPLSHFRADIIYVSPLAPQKLHLSQSTMRAIFYTVTVALVALGIQKVSPLSCPRPCGCDKMGVQCCNSGELAKDACGCCDVCAKVVC